MTDNTLEHLKAEMDAAWTIYDTAFDALVVALRAAHGVLAAAYAADAARADWNDARRTYLKVLEESNA